MIMKLPFQGYFGQLWISAYGLVVSGRNEIGKYLNDPKKTRGQARLIALGFIIFFLGAQDVGEQGFDGPLDLGLVLLQGKGQLQ